MWPYLNFAAASEPDFLSPLLQYGVLGVFAGLLLIYTRGTIARERDKYDQAQEQIDKLNEFIRTELLPKQVETALLHKQVAEVLEQAVNVITEQRIRESVRREQRGPGDGSPSG
jgi:hypothetical protein